MPTLLVASLLATLILAAPAVARPGDLDRSFGVHGTVLEPSSGYPGAQGVDLRPDGSAFLADADRVVRFTRAGRVDPRFRTPAELPDIAIGPVVDRRGRVHVVTETSKRITEFALTRLQPSGAADPGFGENGSRVLPALTGEGTSLTALELDPKGRLLLAGSLRRGRRTRGFIARLLPDGTPDRAFGSAGLVVSRRALATTSVVVRGDGSLVAGESVTRGPRSRKPVLRLRALRASGALDRGFGRRGVVAARAGGRHLLGGATLERGAHGSLLLAGAARGRDGRTDRRSTFVARFTRRGSVDRRFGTRGLVRLRAAGMTTPAVDQDRRGRIVTAGAMDESYAGGEVRVHRLRRSGRPDLRFGRRGIARFLPASRPDLRVTTALVRRVAVRPNGRILVAGTAFDDNFGFRDDVGQPYFALSRLEG